MAAWRHAPWPAVMPILSARCCARHNAKPPPRAAEVGQTRVRREPAVSKSDRFQYRNRGGSVHAGLAVMPYPLDLVLHLQFFTLKLHDFQIIDRGMGQAFDKLLLERLMLLF